MWPPKCRQVVQARRVSCALWAHGTICAMTSLPFSDTHADVNVVELQNCTPKICWKNYFIHICASVFVSSVNKIIPNSLSPPLWMPSGHYVIWKYKTLYFYLRFQKLISFPKLYACCPIFPCVVFMRGVAELVVKGFFFFLQFMVFNVLFLIVFNFFIRKEIGSKLWNCGGMFSSWLVTGN